MSRRAVARTRARSRRRSTRSRAKSREASDDVAPWALPRRGGPCVGGRARRMSLPRGARLGIDGGSGRGSLAAGDQDGLVATPVPTLEPADRARVVTEVRERGAQVVYVGLPRHLSGVEGSAAGEARGYAERLAVEVAPVEVRLVDERMSTVAATAAMRAS